MFEGNLLRDKASRPRLERVVSSTISVRHHIPCTPESVARRGSANNTRVHASLFGHVGEDAARLVSTVAVRHAVAVCPVSLNAQLTRRVRGPITLSPLRRCRRGKQNRHGVWPLSLFLLFFFNRVPTRGTAGIQTGSPGIQALDLLTSRLRAHPPTLVSPRVSSKLRYGGAPEPFCAANQHLRSEPGRGPRPLPAVWPVRHPKTDRSRPRFGRRFFFLCFYFVFRPSQAARRPGCERQRRRSSTLQCISSHTASWRSPNMAVWRRPPLSPRPNFCRSLSSRLSTRNPTPSKPWDQARHGAGYRKYDTTTRPI